MAAPHAAFAPGNDMATHKGRALKNTRSNIVKSAIETCRTGGMDPIKIQMDSARSLYAIAATMQRLHPGAFEDPFGQSKDAGGRVIENKTIVNRFTRTLMSASKIAHGVAEFAYPKFSRIHHVGDAPAGQVNQKVVVTLNLGGAPAVRAQAEADGVTIENEESNGSS